MFGTGVSRDEMVDRQIIGRGIGDARVIAAMRAVRREDFLASDAAPYAYDDTALRIECGQTISQPYIVALMLEAAAVCGADRVLEVGTGSGYAAAVASCLCKTVYTIERHPDLADQAAARLRRTGRGNVHVIHGDGTLGVPDEAPFHAIIVTAASARVPSALRTQLALGGRLIMPLGNSGDQRLVKLLRSREDVWEDTDLGAVAFVPLIGSEI